MDVNSRLGNNELNSSYGRANKRALAKYSMLQKEYVREVKAVSDTLRGPIQRRAALVRELQANRKALRFLVYECLTEEYSCGLSFDSRKPEEKFPWEGRFSVDAQRKVARVEWPLYKKACKRLARLSTWADMTAAPRIIRRREGMGVAYRACLIIRFIEREFPSSEYVSGDDTDPGIYTDIGDTSTSESESDTEL